LQIAQRQGCALIVFVTYDLLAGGLYDRLGYQTVSVVKGCPVGGTTRWYRKEL
jgi:hypothetical protein